MIRSKLFLVVILTILIARVRAEDGLPVCSFAGGFKFGYSDMPTHAMAVADDTVATADESGIHLYRADNLWSISTINTDDFGYFALDWSSDATYLAGYSSSKTFVWQIKDSVEPQMTIPYSDSQQPVHTLVWSHDNTKVALVGNGPTQIWDITGQKLLFEMMGMGTSRATDYNNINHALADWSPNDTYFITSQFDFGDSKDSIGVWETATWTQVYELPTAIHSVEAIVWSSDNQIAISDTGTPVEIWNGETFELARTIEELPNGSRAIAWSPSGKLLAVEYSDREGNWLHIFDTKTNVRLSKFEVDESFVRDIAWASEDIVFARTHDGIVYKWNLVDNCLAGMITYKEP